jgi:hypothetical protein
MSELDYIGPEELVFSNTKEGIYSGGFSVKSIMMKAGMSPIMTINKPNGHMGGSSDKVSDLFNDLVVPNWALSYSNRLIGGKYAEPSHSDSEDDDVVEDDLHDKLLELVKKDNNNRSAKGLQKKITRKLKKDITKKKGTKKRKGNT